MKIIKKTPSTLKFVDNQRNEIKAILTHFLRGRDFNYVELTLLQPYTLGHWQFSFVESEENSKFLLGGEFNYELDPLRFRHKIYVTSPPRKKQTSISGAKNKIIKDERYFTAKINGEWVDFKYSKRTGKTTIINPS